MGEAIEGLLEHLDMLTLLTVAVSLDKARAAAGDEVDWHVLRPPRRRASRGELAGPVVTTHGPTRAAISMRLRQR